MDSNEDNHSERKTDEARERAFQSENSQYQKRMNRFEEEEAEDADNDYREIEDLDLEALSNHEKLKKNPDPMAEGPEETPDTAAQMHEEKAMQPMTEAADEAEPAHETEAEAADADANSFQKWWHQVEQRLASGQALRGYWQYVWKHTTNPSVAVDADKSGYGIANYVLFTLLLTVAGDRLLVRLLANQSQQVFEAFGLASANGPYFVLFWQVLLFFVLAHLVPVVVAFLYEQRLRHEKSKWGRTFARIYAPLSLDLFLGVAFLILALIPNMPVAILTSVFVIILGVYGLVFAANIAQIRREAGVEDLDRPAFVPVILAIVLVLILVYGFRWGFADDIKQALEAFF